MSDFSVKPYNAELAPLQGDIERAVTRLRNDLKYTPAEPSHWVSPLPTTFEEALDRIAAEINTIKTYAAVETGDIGPID